jgi:hypothetical protein
MWCQSYHPDGFLLVSSPARRSRKLQAPSVPARGSAASAGGPAARNARRRRRLPVGRQVGFCCAAGERIAKDTNAETRNRTPERGCSLPDLSGLSRFSVGDSSGYVRFVQISR